MKSLSFYKVNEAKVTIGEYGDWYETLPNVISALDDMGISGFDKDEFGDYLQLIKVDKNTGKPQMDKDFKDAVKFLGADNDHLIDAIKQGLSESKVNESIDHIDVGSFDNYVDDVDGFNAKDAKKTFKVTDPGAFNYIDTDWGSEFDEVEDYLKKNKIPHMYVNSMGESGIIWLAESKDSLLVLEEWDPVLVKKYKALEKKVMTDLTKYFNKLSGENGFIVRRINIGYKSANVDITYNNKFGASINVGKTTSWGEDTPKWYLDGVGGVGRRDDVEGDAVCKTYILQGEVVKNWKTVIKTIEDATSEMYDMYQEWEKAEAEKRNKK